jgi:hypothetical protein
MIATGELRQNFEQFWREAAAQLGNPQSLTERGSGKWQEYQLEKYQPLTSLPESSTASRLVIAISEDESHLKLEQQKLTLQSERRRKRWQNLKKWGHLINSWTWAVVL